MSQTEILSTTARTSVLPAMEEAWRESEAAFSSKSCGWPTSSGPRIYSLKTSSLSELAALTELSTNLMPTGMMLDGFVCPLKTWAPLKSAVDGSALRERDDRVIWPTLTKSDGGRSEKLSTWLRRRGRLDGFGPNNWRGSTLGHAVQAILGMTDNPGLLDPNMCESLMGFPENWSQANEEMLSEELSVSATQSSPRKRAPRSKGSPALSQPGKKTELELEVKDDFDEYLDLCERFGELPKGDSLEDPAVYDHLVGLIDRLAQEV